MKSLCARVTAFLPSANIAAGWGVCVLVAVLFVNLGAELTAFAQQPYHPPLDAYIDTRNLPQDLLSPAPDGGPAPAERLRVEQFEYSQITITEPDAEDSRDIGARMVADLVIAETLRLNVAGMESGFAVEIGNGKFHAEITALGERLSDLPAGTTSSDDLTAIEDIPFRVEITAVSLPIDPVLNPEFFKAMTKDVNGNYQPSTTDSDGDGVIDPARLRVTLVAGMKLVVRYTWDGETDFFFEGGGGAGTFPSFGPLDSAVMLGESGIVLEIAQIAVDSTDSGSPSTVTQGPTWKGVVLESVSVAFTNGLKSKGTGGDLTSAEPGLTLALQNFQIGTGGISGSISGSGLGVDIDLEGLDMTIDSVELGFQQNALTSSRIVGVIKDFPFFEKDLKLELALDMSGNFKIGVAADDPNRNAAEIAAWEIQDVITLEIQSIAFEYREKVFYTRLNGTIVPKFL